MHTYLYKVAEQGWKEADLTLLNDEKAIKMYRKLYTNIIICTHAQACTHMCTCIQHTQRKDAVGQGDGAIFLVSSSAVGGLLSQHV